MKRKNLSIQAYETLKEKILTNEYKPGEKIVELELSEKLNMSRTPIRSALAMLENDKLITNNSRNETVVSKLSLDTFLEIYDVYENLEMLAVKLASQKRTSEDLLLLDEIKSYRKELMETETFDFYEFLNIDREFHKSLWNMSKNKMLVSELERLNEIYKRYIYYINIDQMDQRAITVVDEHISILEAIYKRNMEEAQLLIQLHLRFIRENTILYFAKLKDERPDEITI